jgi:hypothetical protein
MSSRPAPTSDRLDLSVDAAGNGGPSSPDGAPPPVDPFATPDGAPPIDWAGELRIRQPIRAIAQPVLCTLIPSALAYATYLAAGATTDAFLAMVAVGTTTGVVACCTDRRLLRRRWTR